MDELGTLLQRGIERHQAGKFGEAETAYRAALERQPEHWDTRYLLGTVLLQQGRFSECIAVLETVVAERPDAADAQNNLGVAHKALGQWKEAARAFELTIRSHPEYVSAYFNLGTLMSERGLHADAEKCFSCALTLNDADPDLHRHLANALKEQEKWFEAESAYRRSMELQSENLDVQVNLGYVLVRQEKLDEATEVFRRILTQKPDYCEIHNNLSYIAERQGRFEEAVAEAQQALAICPDFADAYNNWGTALRSQHQLSEACDCFQKALELRPGFALAEFNDATTRLLAGDYASGWSGYERRTEAAGRMPRVFSQPRWKDEPMPGLRLLVYADQGFGDTIQFARFLTVARERSQADVLLECQPELSGLLSNLSAVSQVSVEGDSLPPFDAQIPIASLPGVLGIEESDLSDEVPYLSPVEVSSCELMELIQSAARDHLKVGLCWRGNPAQARDVLRSCPLQTLRPLADVAHVTFFSLQTDDVGLHQLMEVAPDWSLVDLGSRFRDFSDTAAALTQLDLIITVDTAVAHLAGALGRPTWTLLCHTPDWRWHLDRVDSLWYPTMRLFRQNTWGNWQSVISSVCAELERVRSLSKT